MIILGPIYKPVTVSNNTNGSKLERQVLFVVLLLSCLAIWTKTHRNNSQNFLENDSSYYI